MASRLVMTTRGRSMNPSVNIPDNRDFDPPNRGIRNAYPNSPNTMLGVLHSALVATSTTCVKRPSSAYSARKTAAPTPRGTANRTAPTTSQIVPTMAGRTPLTSANSDTPFITNGQ
jgi:hypothetical protein